MNNKNIIGDFYKKLCPNFFELKKPLQDRLIKRWAENGENHWDLTRHLGVRVWGLDLSSGKDLMRWLSNLSDKDHVLMRYYYAKTFGCHDDCVYFIGRLQSIWPGDEHNLAGVCQKIAENNDQTLDALRYDSIHWVTTEDQLIEDQIISIAQYVSDEVTDRISGYLLNRYGCRAQDNSRSGKEWVDRMITNRRFMIDFHLVRYDPFVSIIDMDESSRIVAISNHEAAQKIRIDQWHRSIDQLDQHPGYIDQLIEDEFECVRKSVDSAISNGRPILQAV